MIIDRKGFFSILISPAKIWEAGKDIRIGNTKQQVKLRYLLHILPDLMQGAACIEMGILIDIFTPHGEDFV